MDNGIGREVGVRNHWKRVDSGGLLYIPVVRFCWGRHKYATKIYPCYLALEPCAASMYEICLDDEKEIPMFDIVKKAPGMPRIWINTVWDALAAKGGEGIVVTKGNSIILSPYVAHIFGP